MSKVKFTILAFLLYTGTIAVMLVLFVTYIDGLLTNSTTKLSEFNPYALSFFIYLIEVQLKIN